MARDQIVHPATPISAVHIASYVDLKHTHSMKLEVLHTGTATQGK